MASQEPGGSTVKPAVERPLFTVAGKTYRWADVILAAQLRGDWEELQHRAAQGLACLRRLTASGEELDGNTLTDAEMSFRRDRNLLAGEETIEWLERRELTVGEWRDHLRRALLRERWVDELDETSARFPAAEDEVAAVIWAEAVCSGFLEQAAWRLAGDAALAVEAGETLAGEPEHALPRIAAAADRLRAEGAAEEALEREVASHGLDWLRVDAELLELPTEDMAREVAFCVRDDRRPLAEVAADCGAEPRPLRIYIGEAGPELVPSLLGADEGELVGPLDWNDGFALVLVESKARPTAADPEVRRKAEAAVVRRITERAIAANVSWHELV